jgi:hypothetical protein
VNAATPGRAAYEKWAAHEHELDDWSRDLADSERGKWESIAQAGIDASAYVRQLERDVPDEQPCAAPGHVVGSWCVKPYDVPHTHQDKQGRKWGIAVAQEPQAAPELGTDADASAPLIVAEDQALNGPMLSWYASMPKAESHHDTLTASRDGVLPDGNTFLHQIPSSWLSAAVRAYGLLREGKAGEALAMATHERLDGRIVEVAR